MVGAQNLAYSLWDLDQRHVTAQGLLPLSEDAELDWLGFSETGLPILSDSKVLIVNVWFVLCLKV